MIENYNKEVIDESYKEMINFVSWVNKQYGYYPIIIGGWAVSSYVPDAIGSKDIDVIFPARESIDRVLLPYYQAASYKSKGIFTKRFYKEVKTKRRIERVYLDICSLADKNLLHENTDIELPWSLGMKHSKEWKIESAVARVPHIEVLLLYKVKAFLDRRFDLKSGINLSTFEREHIKSKIWKDEQDITQLRKCDLNKKFLDKLLSETKFGIYFKSGMNGLYSATKKFSVKI